MLRRVACLLSLLCLFSLSLRSQPATETPRQPRILLLLDGSSSMLQPWSGNEIRFKAAARIVDGLMDSIYAVNPNVEFGLRVYGHQSPAQNNDCYDSRMEVMFSKNNITQMGLRLASLRPYGVSPIAYSLGQAAQYDLLDEVNNAYAIILITDGGESCGGNICDVVRKLIERKIYFRPYVISLVDYAPLKEQYACLGSYLKIAKPEEIGPSLNKIVDAYRPILSMPAIYGTPRPDGRSSAPTPEGIKLAPPVVTIPPPTPHTVETTAVLRMSALRLMPVPASSWFRIAPRNLAIPKGPYFVYTPEPRSRDTFTAIESGGMKVKFPSTGTAGPKPGTIKIPDPGRPTTVPLDSLATSRGTRPLTAPVGSPVKPQPVGVPDPGRPATVALDKLGTNPRIGTLPATPVISGGPAPISVPDPGRVPAALLAVLRADSRLRFLTVPPRAIVQPRVAPVPNPGRFVFVRDSVPAVAVVTPPKPAPLKEPTIKMVELPRDTARRITGPKPKITPAPAPEVRISRDSAKETQISIYFTDGRGKFYASSPQLRLLDAKTNAQVRQFYRTVDPSGNPDPQPIPGGTYNLMVATRSNLLLKNIVIEPNKNNKVIVKVTNGSLRFRYENNPNRPVTEFNATVNIRFEDGPINQKQRCAEELEYAPGNYHVEISTLPVFQLNTDIDFGAITQIDIPEPGYIQFTNTNNIGPVQLFSPLGNRFMRFYGLRVQGTPDAQRVRLLPGAYEAHWLTNPGTPRAKEEILRFNVRSNMVTEIELN